MIKETQVAIIGAGPAGLAAAAAASEAGCRVTLIDSYARPGGQYYKQTPLEFQARTPQALHHDFAKAEQLFARVSHSPQVEILNNTTVWSLQAGPDAGSPVTLYLSSPTGSSELRAVKLILAPGAYDRTLPFPGWDLPGVLTAGAAQTLVKSQRVLPGRRVVLSGAGPFLLPVAVGLAQGGAKVSGLFEATQPLQWSRYAPQAWGHWDKLAEGFEYLKLLRNYGISQKFGRAVIRAEGENRLERVTVARLGVDWTPIVGSEEQIEADTLCLGYGFLPSTELSYLLGCEHYYDPVQAAFVVRHDSEMQSSRSGVFVAGEITGIGGSAVALPQGTLAGIAVAKQLWYLSDNEAEAQSGAARQELRHQQAFAQVLNRLFALRPGRLSWMTPDTIVCRCEEVTSGQLKTAVGQFQAQDAKTIKLTTRCGMGLCQGRVCGHTVTALTATLTGNDPAQVGTFTSRPIVKPLTLEELVAASD